MDELIDMIREEYIYDKGQFIQQFVLKRVGVIQSFAINTDDLDRMISLADYCWNKIDRNVNDDLNKLDKSIEEENR